MEEALRIGTITNSKRYEYTVSIDTAFRFYSFCYSYIFWTFDKLSLIIHIVILWLVTGEKRKSSSESFSLSKREGSAKRHSKRSRHQNETRQSMTLNPEETKSKNTASSMECTCSLYVPRLSENSQDQIRMSKRDACTSPTIPSPNNMTYTTRKGSKFITSDLMICILHEYIGKRINLSKRFLNFFH